MSGPTLSIVIVSYNVRQELQNCLRSLHDAPPAVPHEIVVVDNASRDGTADATRSAWPDVTVIDSGGNLGFSAGNNVGIRASSGDLVLLLNSDTIVPAGALDGLLSRLDSVPGVVAAGPRLVDANGEPELSFGRMIGPINEIRQKVLLRTYASGWPLVVRYVRRATREERLVDWVSGACLLVRRREAEAVGLLDERFFMYTEDVDFCASLRARGGKILFTPAAQITHLRGRSVATAPKATEVFYRRSHVAFYEKHHRIWAPALRAYLRMHGKI